MKLIIDISEEEYILAKKEDFSAVYNGNHIAKAVKNGISLEEKTNGEVIQTLFPEASVNRNGFIVEVELEAFGFNVEDDWWNTPYKENK